MTRGTRNQSPVSLLVVDNSPYSLADWANG
jgi:hypothetical protein